MLRLKQPQKSLAFLPTPFHKLTNLSKYLNQQIFIKRDDQTGLACGGNKTRKLEYLFGDALQHDIDSIVTAGALQSNHCRQTAAAAAQLGLPCHLLLNSKQPDLLEGNTLLDHLFGATVYFKQEADAPQNLEELAKRLQKEGKKPYIIPYGGSNAFGVIGYINAMIELKEQLEITNTTIDTIVLASCSGATQVGMILGAKLTGFIGKIIGISVDYSQEQHAQYLQEHLQLAAETIKLLNLNIPYTAEDFILNYDYLGKGYGVMGKLEKDAITAMAHHEGILLDPVYTGRAFGGLLEMIKKNQIIKDETVLFWHTGGIPGIFAYTQVLSQE